MREIFAKNCFDKQECDIEFQYTEAFKDSISQECKQRILYDDPKLTSNNFILIAGCKSDTVKVFPLAEAYNHKHSAGIIIICFEIVSILIITFFF